MKMVIRDTKMNPFLYYFLAPLLIFPITIALLLIIPDGSINSFKEKISFIFLALGTTIVIMFLNNSRISLYKVVLDFEKNYLIEGIVNKHSLDDIDGMMIYSVYTMYFSEICNTSYKGVMSLEWGRIFNVPKKDTDAYMLSELCILFFVMKDGSVIMIKRDYPDKLLKLRRKIYDNLGRDDININQVFLTGSKYNEIDPKMES